MAMESWTDPVELESEEFLRVPPGPDGVYTKPLRFFPAFTLAGPAGHTDRVDSVAFAPDSTMLASGSRDGTVRLWDVETRSHIATLSDHTGACAALGSLAFSADGTTLACGCDHGSLLLWDLASRRLKAAWSSSPALTPCSVAFSTFAPLLVCNLSDKTVDFFDLSTWRRIGTIDIEMRRSYIGSLALSPNGRTLAIGGFDSAQIVQLAEGLATATLDGTGFVAALAYRPDSKVLAVGGEHTAARREAGDEGFGTAHFFATSSDYQYIASLPTDRDTPAIKSVAFHPGGQMIACGYADGLLRLWHFSTLAYQATLRTYEACHVAFAPDGKTLAVGSGNGISVWK